MENLNGVQPSYGYADLGSALLGVINLIFFLGSIVFFILGIILLIKVRNKEFTLRFIIISFATATISIIVAAIIGKIYQYITYDPNQSSYYRAVIYQADSVMIILIHTLVLLASIIVSTVLNFQYNNKHATVVVCLVCAYFSFIIMNFPLLAVRNSLIYPEYPYIQIQVQASDSPTPSP